MSQDSNKNDNKSRLPKFTNRSSGSNNDGEAPRKGPKFSIYWVYAIIFAVLIGFQFFGPFSTSLEKTNFEQFKQMIANGDVSKYIIVDNRDMVKVFLKPESIQKYAAGSKTKFTQEG
ncbi:MAG TPA: ATP-dependent metallopeptidase FtsH/Yme1/Tma family protein, partial [Flavisolibacter sp.]|nr:ATP-dependent metallopeptidase FtsH/Yme1/Tma family protein [Flavisolibacter sp.]